MRPSGRQPDSLRAVALEPDVMKHAEGSCLAKFGDTHVLCSASVDDSTPGWMRNSGKGWITAEYGMLPRSTHSRMDREAARGKQSGRTQEIQRLIGRSLRAAVDLKLLGERSIRVDCDVIQADGGTRTAAITGGWVALHRAIAKLDRTGALPAWPIKTEIAAISCGVYEGVPVLDLDYAEDSNAGADANFVLTGDGRLVEAQATAEKALFDRPTFNQLLDLAEKGCAELAAMQRAAVGAA